MSARIITSPRVQAFALTAAVALSFASPVVAGPPTVAEDEYSGHASPSAEAMVFDTVVVRPLMLVGTAVGALFYGISYPFSAAAGNTEEARRRLVDEPARHVVGRPLGHFD